MELTELRRQWTSRFQPDIQARIWDRAAPEYEERPLPDWEEDPFLALLRRRGALGPSVSALDIGCGAGGYSLALAPHVGAAVGCDLSARMVEGATRRAAGLGLSNARFHLIDWHAFDPAERGWERAFDVVFAHMTPAVSDYDTLEKMVRCARGTCFLQKNTRRRDAVLDAALALVGIQDPQAGRDDVDKCFTYLWLKGYEPHLDYRQEVWRSQRSTASMAGWCVDRARLRRDITAQEEERIRDFVAASAVEGVVRETVTTTVVTMDWAV